ncbi:MAG: hypothetical protein ACFFCD_15760 [Promethearchaeota archaeon]
MAENRKKIRRDITAIGILFLVIGLILVAVGLRPTFKTVENTEILLYVTDYPLSDNYTYFDTTLKPGDMVSGTIKTSNPVNFYIFDNDQYNTWQTTYSYSPNAPSIFTRTHSNNIAFSIQISYSNTYYLVVHNYYDYSDCVIRSWYAERTYFTRVEYFDYSLMVAGVFTVLSGFLIIAIGLSTRLKVEKEV